MNNFEVEKEELALIYENNFIIKSKDCIQINITIGMKYATIVFTVPVDYPKSIPQISVELAGISGKELETQLIKAAQTMIGVAMIAYLVGEAIDYLNGLSDKEIVEQQEHVKATPFSREAFLLWLDKFKKELELKEAEIPKPMTGRQWFEENGRNVDTS